MPYDDLRKTIKERALVFGKDAKIIHSEKTGTESTWIFDFRTIVLDPVFLNRYAEIFWERYADKFPFQVGGLETASIPMTAAIVMKSTERGTPVSGFYVRKSRDRDGLMKRVEGTLTDTPIILVDDLIHSGNSFLKQLKALDDIGKGAQVSDIFTVLAYRPLERYTFARERGITISHLFTLADFGIDRPVVPEVPDDRFEELWRFRSARPSMHVIAQKSAPVIDDTRVYFGADEGVFRALVQKTGDVAWEFKAGKHPKGKGILSSPALHKGVIYFGAYDGCVYALDAATGALKWKYEDADWVGSSPYLAPDLGLLFIGLEFGLFRKRGGIAALDMKTGECRWQDRTPALTHCSPLYIKEEGLVVIGSNDSTVYAYDAWSGERRWTHQTGGDIKTRASYDPKRRLVLVPSMDGRLYALSAKNGEPHWAFPTFAGIYSVPLIDGDRVLVSSLDKTVYAVDLDTGAKMCMQETAGRIFASPTLADGSLWIGSNDGRLYELDPQTLVRRTTYQLSERIVNAIAFNPKTRHFFVPTAANEMYCLKRKAVATQ